MNSEESRLRTFGGWPDNAPVDPKRIAKAGFYWMGQGLEVQCFSCGSRISEWNYADKVMARHKALDPRCPFVLNPRQSGNVPLCSVRPVASGSSLPLPPLRVLNGDSTDSAARRSLVPNPYQDEAVRLASFDEWPISNIVSPAKLASAGFYYTNIQSKVICAYCDGVIVHWKPGDDPELVHQKCHPACDFINDRLKYRIHPYSNIHVRDPVKITESCKSRPFSEVDVEENSLLKSTSPNDLVDNVVVKGQDVSLTNQKGFLSPSIAVSEPEANTRVSHVDSPAPPTPYDLDSWNSYVLWLITAQGAEPHDAVTTANGYWYCQMRKSSNVDPEGGSFQSKDSKAVSERSYEKDSSTAQTPAPSERQNTPLHKIRVGIAHANFPRTLLTLEEMNDVKKEMIALILAGANEVSPFAPDLYPQFAYTSCQCGWLLLVCMTQTTVEWVQKAVHHMVDLEGAQLQLLQGKDTPTTKVVMGFFPDSADLISEEILFMLRKQNPHLPTAHWKVMKRVNKAKHTEMKIVVDEASAAALQANRKVHYMYRKATLAPTMVKKGMRYNARIDDIKLVTQGQESPSSSAGEKSKKILEKKGNCRREKRKKIGEKREQDYWGSETSTLPSPSRVIMEGEEGEETVAPPAEWDGVDVCLSSGSSSGGLSQPLDWPLLPTEEENLSF